jgi:hypothetical protein
MPNWATEKPARSPSGGEELQKRILYAVIVFMLTVATVSLPSVLADDAHSGAGSQLNPASCGSTQKSIINVSQKVVNDPDSGTKGNVWAYDNFTRHIQIWETASNTFCAIAWYEGRFIAQKGQTSPGGTAILADNATGEFEAGFRTTIIGTLLASPSAPTKGFIGKTDCERPTSSSCTGYVQSWTTLYFSSVTTFTLNSWGWTHHNDCGTWVNAITGTNGDIGVCTNGDEGQTGD